MLWFALVSGVMAEYTEQLTLQPLSNSLLLSQFEFSASQPQSSSRGPLETHYTLFPRTLGQILEQTYTSELHLRFSQGWWDHESWGTEPNNGSSSGGIGVELWANVEGSSAEQVQKRWYKLVHSLSGLFCASLNFIDEQSTSIKQNGNKWTLKGSLPGEPVCTENLTPFLKLLPCKSWAGIGAILDGHSLFDSQWQTMALDVSSGAELVLNQSISSVMNVPRLLRRRDSPLPKPLERSELNCKPGHPGCLPQTFDHQSWNLESVFGTLTPCPLAQSQIVVKDWQVEVNGVAASNQFVLTEATNLTISGSNQSATPKPPISVDRSFTGAGQQDGGIRLVFTNNDNNTSTLEYSEVLPWYMRVYLHTLQAPQGAVKAMDYRGAKIRGRPTQLDLSVEVPANSQVSIEYQFDKSLLFIEEYPPDANHGFEIAPGMAQFGGYVTRTTSLLLSLPVPDFSMPYNVIILTCTTLTLMISNILAMLIKVVIPEPVGEKYNKGKLDQLKDSVSQGVARLKRRWTKQKN